MFDSTIAGSLPKPSWLAETQKLWPQWKWQGEELLLAKADATLLWIKAQEDAGLDIIGDGERARQHFVHGFVEHVGGIDFANKVTMGIRNKRYDAQVPQVVGPLTLNARVHTYARRRRLGREGVGACRPGPGPACIPRCAGLHHRRAYLLRLRHQGQHRLEADAGRRVAAI